MEIMFAVKRGEPSYKEQIITENENRFEAARAWCKANGFDRIRIANIDLSTTPDFRETIIRLQK